ncbi:UNVERIFIED_CONTAM: stage V sporulation protein B [Acetivibrio alkalicellulosi]
MKKQSIAQGFAVLSIASMCAKVLSVLYIPFIRAILEDEGYGIYGAAYQVYVFIYVIANSGIPVAISKSISELTSVGNYRYAFKTFKISRFYLIVIGTVLAIAMFALARPLANIVKFEKSYLAILALSPTIFFTAIASAYRGYFQGRGVMTPTAVSQVIEQIVHIIFSLTFAMLLLQYGIEYASAGATVGTTMGALASALFLMYVFYKNKNSIIPVDYNQNNVKRYSFKELSNKILNYSLPITICVAAQYAGNLIDMGNTKSRLLFAGFLDEQATSLFGFLVKYQQLMNVPISIVVALAATVLPSLSGSLALNDKIQFENKLRYAIRLCLFIVIPSAIGFSVLSEPIYLVLKFGEGSELMMYGAIVLVLMSIVQIQTTILQGAGRLYTATTNVLIGIVGKIIANYFLIAIYDINIYGAIIGSVVGFGIPVVLNTIAIKKYLKVKINLINQSFKPLISSIIMGIFVYLTYIIVFLTSNLIFGKYLSNALGVFLSVIIGVAIYIVSMMLIKGITLEDIDQMPGKLKKLIPSKLLNIITKASQS